MTTETRPQFVSPRNDRFCWAKQQDYKSLVVLSEIWRQLSPIDRQVYAEVRTVSINPNSTGDSEGDAARFIGAADIEVKFIGLCGEPRPIPIEHSATVQKRAEDIEGRLINELQDRGAPIGQSLSHMFFALGEISTRHLPDQPSPTSPEWKNHYRLEKETFFAWLIEDGTIPEEPPF